MYTVHTYLIVYKHLPTQATRCIQSTCTQANFILKVFC